MVSNHFYKLYTESVEWRGTPRGVIGWQQVIKRRLHTRTSTEFARKSNFAVRRKNILLNFQPIDTIYFENDCFIEEKKKPISFESAQQLAGT